jgi:hypothetical protein
MPASLVKPLLKLEGFAVRFLGKLFALRMLLVIQKAY